MARLRLDTQDLAYTTLLERVSGAQVKDCFQSEDTVYFVIATGDMGKAIGKKGATIRRLEKEFKKRVKMVEFDEDAKVFLGRFLAPIRVQNVEISGETLTIKTAQRKTKGLLIGREGKHLSLLNRALQRLYQKQVKVI